MLLLLTCKLCEKGGVAGSGTICAMHSEISRKEKFIAYFQAAFLKCLKRDNVVYHGLAGHFFLRGISHALKVNELPFINGGEPVKWIPEIPIWFSLGFIALTITVATIASLLKTRKVAATAARETDAVEDPTQESVSRH